MMNNEKLEDVRTLLVDVAASRRNLEAERERLNDSKILLENTGEYKAHQENLTIVKLSEQIISDTENMIRDMVVEIAQETGEKKPINGASAVSTKNVTILDEKKAKAWVSENAPDLITINLSKLKKAVINLSLDFVEITETYSGRIASDLSEYLITEDEDETEEVDLSS
jgi:hypothetical protein